MMSLRPSVHKTVPQTHGPLRPLSARLAFGPLPRVPGGLSMTGMRRCKSDIGQGHLASQLRDALAEDARMNVLDVEVQIIEGHVHLHGQVASEELKRQAQAIAEELTEGMPVHNRLHVTSEPAQSPRNEQIR